MYCYTMKTPSIPFLLLLFLSIQLYANGGTGNSINNITKIPEEIESSSLLYEFAFAYTDVDTLLLLAQCDSSIAIVNKFGDSTLLIDGYRKKAWIFRHIQKFQKSVDLLDKAISIATRTKGKALKMLYNEQGLNYYFLGNYSKALENHLKCLMLCELYGDKSEISTSFYNVGLVNYKLRNYEKALEYFHSSLSLKHASKDSFERNLLLITTGFCYAGLKNFPAALKVISEGLTACGKNCNEEVQLVGNFGLGMILFNQGDFDKAQGHLNRSLARSKSKKNNRFQAENLLYLARIYLKQGNYKAVGIALREAEGIATKFNYSELLLDAYDQYSGFYRVLREYQRAVGYQEKYTELRDRLYGEELLHKISALQVEFEARHEVKTIKEQNELLALQEKTLRQRRLVNIIIGIVAFMLLVILTLLYHSYAGKKRLNQRLDELVQEKTLDLEMRHQHLYEANEKLQQFLLNTVEQFNAPLATLRGICHVGKMEIQDPDMLKYFEKLEEATDDMTEIVTFKAKVL